MSELANKTSEAELARTFDRSPAAADFVEHGRHVDGQELLNALHQAMHECANAELAKRGQSANDCPYLAAWFERHAGDSMTRLRQAAHRYAPKSAGARSDAEFIRLVRDRVREGFQAHLANGSLSGVPADLPVDLDAAKPGLLELAMPAMPVAQRCGSTEDPLAQAKQEERIYWEEPTLEHLEAWDRQLRDNVGFRWGTFSARQQQQITTARKNIAAGRKNLQAGERQERALALRESLGQVATSASLSGVPNAMTIRDYTSPDTGRAESFFNKPLRDLDATEDQANAITSLQNSLLMSPVHTGEVLWRGTGHLIGGAQASSLQPDTEYREPGFLSTSRKRSIAEGFGKGNDSHYMIRIRRHRSGREITSLGGDEYGGGEEEILFPAGCTFRYTGYSKEDRCYDYEEG